MSKARKERTRAEEEENDDGASDVQLEVDEPAVRDVQTRKERKGRVRALDTHLQASEVSQAWEE